MKRVFVLILIAGVLFFLFLRPVEGPQYLGCTTLLLSLGVVDLLREDKLTLNELARREGVSPSSCWRWTQRGVKGQKLEAFTVAGRRYTTHQAFERWVVAVNKARDGEQPTRARTNRQREKNQSQAEAYAEREGF